MVPKKSHWRLRQGDPFRFNDPDDDDDDDKKKAKPLTAAEVRKALAASEKRTLAAVEKAIKAGGGGLDLSSIDDLVEKLVGGDDDDDPADPPADPPAPSGGNDDDTAIPAGIRAELDSLKQTIKSQSTQLATFKTKSDSSSAALVAEKRSSRIKALFPDALDPDMVVREISALIIQDEALGDAIEVDTELGKDNISLDDYATRYREEKDFLFKSPDGKKRSGSGGGGSDAVLPGGKSVVTADQLRDPDDGGMDWDDYEKNQPKIHKALEAQHRTKK